MKTSNTSAKQASGARAAKLDHQSAPDSRSSKPERQTSKTRNFGWLVKGMVEACHQINTKDLVED